MIQRLNLRCSSTTTIYQLDLVLNVNLNPVFLLAWTCFSIHIQTERQYSLLPIQQGGVRYKPVLFCEMRRWEIALDKAFSALFFSLSCLVAKWMSVWEFIVLYLWTRCFFICISSLFPTTVLFSYLVCCNI